MGTQYCWRKKHYENNANVVSEMQSVCNNYENKSETIMLCNPHVVPAQCFQCELCDYVKSFQNNIPVCNDYGVITYNNSFRVVLCQLTGNYYIFDSENKFQCNRNVMYRKMNWLPDFLMSCSAIKKEVQPKSCGQDNAM